MSARKKSSGGTVIADGFTTVGRDLSPSRRTGSVGALGHLAQKKKLATLILP